MVLDGIVLVCIAGWGVAGYFSGMLMQFFRLAALIGSYFFAQIAAPVILAELDIGVSPRLYLYSLALTLLLWVLSYFILVTAGHIAAGGVHAASETLEDSDRAAGLLLGLLKGTVFSVCIVLMLLLYQSRIAAGSEDFSRTMQQSVAVHLVQSTPLPLLASRFLADG